ncbi:MAG: V-type ATP synthase subunit D [Candidatus Omnitrophica bacterium]|nr:V-type ATP synthase subunit D [Candidatus Omnitrophota bacterium]
MRINVPATKTNFLKIKQTLLLTQEGYQLLDEKRRILMLELSSIEKTVLELQDKIDKEFQQAYDTLSRAISISGKKKLEDISLAVNIEMDLFISQKRRMGVAVPVISMDIKETAPFYSFSDINIIVDETIAGFKKLLNLIIELTELKTALIRIAKEIQKTIRKVNALEKIHIPNYKETVKFIGERLDEESRESFTMLKIIKERLGRV